MYKNLSNPVVIMFLIIVTFLILTSVFMSTLASATIFYVSPSGNAHWSKCTNSRTPCAVLTAMKQAKAGDTVNFLSGIYTVKTSGNYERPALRPSNSGTSDNPIIFKAHSGTVIIKASNTNSADSPLIGSSGMNWIVWDGFILDTSNYSNDIGQGPVYFGHAKHCIIRNSEIIGHHSTLNDNFTGIAGQHTDFLTISNNRIHGFKDSNFGRGSAILFFYASNTVVENNDLSENNIGIHDKEEAKHNIYRFNFIHDNSDYAFWLMSQNDHDIDDVQLYHNIFSNNLAGINIGADAPMTITNLKWYNNTIHNSGWISIGNEKNNKENMGSSWNNIIVISNAPAFGGSGTGAPDYVDYNNYYGSNQKWLLHYGSGEQKYSSLSEWQKKTGFDKHSINADPHFLNASGRYVTATDFKRKSYPFNGRGGSYASVMGAYITGNEIIGYSGPKSSASSNEGDPSPTISNKNGPGECESWQTKHPDWIFCDDFEDGSALVRPGRYIEYGDASGRFTLTDGIGYKGSKGMKAVWHKWDVGAGGLKFAFGRNPGHGMNNGVATERDFKEVYYRIYMKLQDGWQGNPQKLSRATVISGPDWSQAMIAHLWGDNSTHLSIDPASCVSGKKVRCNGYNDFGHLSWMEQRSGKTALFDGRHNAQWFCIEAHVKLNDPGKSNGEQEFWINGKQEAKKSEINFVGNYTEYGINAIFIENYWNEGAHKNEERYIDNFVVSTKRIGCLE